MILIKKPFRLDFIFMPLKRQIAVDIKRKKKYDGLLVPKSFNPQWLGSRVKAKFPTPWKKCWYFFFSHLLSRRTRKISLL